MLTYYIKTYPLSIIVALVIIVISMIPFPEIKFVEDVPLADKWTHMVMYGGLSFVIWAEYLYRHAVISYKKLLAWGFVAPCLLGGALELAQAYLTTCRSGEWLDFLADSIGAAIILILGLTLMLPFAKRQRQKKGSL